MIDAWRRGELLPEGSIFTSFEEAPFDRDDLGDGDNSLLSKWPKGVPINVEFPVKREKDARWMLNESVQIAPSRLIVPLSRTLKNGMSGKDVFSMQRALSRAGYRRWGTFTQNYREGCVKQVSRFQRDHDLHVDGQYGQVTHAILKRYYDAWGARLMVEAARALAPNGRKRIVAAAMFGYNNRARIHYTQSTLRMYGVRHRIAPPRIPIYEDCSSFATWCYWLAGAPDPNGFDYSGIGYTGTLSVHGREMSIASPGDLVFYGHRWPFGHVTIVVGGGRCVSHGNEAGPQLLPIGYRSIAEIRTYPTERR